MQCTTGFSNCTTGPPPTARLRLSLSCSCVHGGGVVILTADYDRGLKNVLGAKANYERYEFNGEYIHHLNKLQLLEARVGVGFYTRKGGKSLFLSYENFQEDNIQEDGMTTGRVSLNCLTAISTTRRTTMFAATLPMRVRCSF